MTNQIGAAGFNIRKRIVNVTEKAPVAQIENRLGRLGYDKVNQDRIVNSICNGDDIVIVGENMKRVNAVASMVNKAGGKSKIYSPRNLIGLSRKELEANRSWIRYWAKIKQATIIDIGRQSTTRPYGLSPFYGIENSSLNKWGVFTPFK